MAGDDKKAKATPAPKKEAASESKSTEAEGGAGAAPPGYSRGEGQKPVSKAYTENWNLIFGKKKRKR